MLNQFRRIWADNGKNDKDFSQQELAYKIAKDNLDRAILEFQIASTNLYNTLLKVN